MNTPVPTLVRLTGLMLAIHRSRPMRPSPGPNGSRYSSSRSTTVTVRMPYSARTARARISGLAACCLSTSSRRYGGSHHASMLSDISACGGAISRPNRDRAATCSSQ